tara:strand:- start:6210 stop:12983 length:6774 start_codon:yes stop_codon:yes gene_type:complete
MPELKHNFLKGRMNKDLDERLVPNGEYRDALNVEVSTSEESNVGAVQTTRGNIKLSDIPVTENTKCVGEVVDEKNDKLYWLVSEAGTKTRQSPDDYILCDLIMEYDKTTEVAKPIVVDIFETQVEFKNHNPNPGAGAYQDGDIISVDSASWSGDADYTIYPGMEIEMLGPGGVSQFPEGTTVVDVFLDQYQVVLSNPPIAGNTLSNINSIISLKFKNVNRALNFLNERPDGSSVITGINIIDDFLFWTDNNSEPKKINIKTSIYERNINPYIYFPTFDLRRATDYNTQSMLVVKDLTVNDPTAMTIARGNLFTPTAPVPLEEKYVTVVKRSPEKSLNLEMRNSPREGNLFGILNYSQPTGAVIDGFLFPNQSITTAVPAPGPFNPFWDPTGNGQMRGVGEVVWINFGGPDSRINQISLSQSNTGFAPNVPIYETDDILNIKVVSSGSTIEEIIRVKVSGGIVRLQGLYEVEILSFSSTITGTDYLFEVELEQPAPLFEFKFPRFSYRYKYEDGEYSAFAPFSEIAFLPEKFEYLSKKGYNLGMVNNLRKLVVKDFIDDKLLPKDVISVDILYKESNSPNIYTVRTITRDDFEWHAIADNVQAIDSNTGEYSGLRGYVKITSELIHAVLPSNQLLRPYDNVPRKALSQEITGNRLVYGNYLQNYNMVAEDNSNINISLELTSISRNVGREYGIGFHYSPEQRDEVNAYRYDPSKSIKSLRTYQLGIVYRDKYGRETPVFSNSTKLSESGNTASLYLEKAFAKQQNKLKAQVKHEAPAWADSFKFFLKETSNEYYNLAMDRWYDAEDENVWLSFPSSERNKVDEDTFLILKKEANTNNSVDEAARYKILSIVNEAPIFIKTTEQSFGRLQNADASGGNNFPSTAFRTNSGTTVTGFPLPNASFMYVAGNLFGQEPPAGFQGNTGGIGWNRSILEAGRGNLYMRMRTPGQVSNWYKITSISLEQGVGAAYPDYYRIDIDEGVFADDMSITCADTNPAAMTDANISAGLSLEIKQDIIENKPEFEGRFFVKVFRDQLLVDRIIQPSLDAQEYAVRDSRQIGYVNDSTTNRTTHVGDQYGIRDANGVIDPATWQSEGITTAPFWANQYGWDSNQVPQFLGQGVQVSQIQDEGINTGIQYWNNKSGWFIDQSIGFRPPGGGTNGGCCGWVDVRRSYGRGIWNGGRDIHLSYTNIGDNQSQSPWRRSIFEWNRYANEVAFINSLTAQGTLFRFREDPDQHIYITQATWQPNAGQNNNMLYGEQLFNYFSFPTGTRMMIQNHNEGRSMRNRFHIACQRLDNPSVGIGRPGGTVDSSYSPVNDPSNATYFNTVQPGVPLSLQGTCTGDSSFDGNPQACADAGLTYVSSGLTNPPTIAPGIRQDWDGPANFKTATTSGANDNFLNQPGRVTLQIVEPIVRGENLENSSANPAIWETEPKEDIGLDIYHEVGQVYHIELNEKTNEQFAPINSVVHCWRPDSSIYSPTGSIQLGNPQNPTPTWSPPIKVSSWNDNVVTLKDNTGALFVNNLNFTNEHAAPGDHLSFVRPDGSRNSTIVESIDGAQYTLKRDIHEGVKDLPWSNCYSFGNGVESDRVRDDFNQVTIDNGPKASTTLEEPYLEERRGSGLIYSGIYNSISGINNLNQFIQAEKITKDLNPTYGSIQKLHSRDTDLITLCEDKIIKVLANKDALFNADGNTNVTATSNVLGQSVPFVGEYGISKNPESFVSESFRAYFTDKQRGAVIRLSRDGITPISEAGMKDWFADNLPSTKSLIGSYDKKKSIYNLTLDDKSITVSYSEKSKGWPSFKSFVKETGSSLNNNYYTFKSGQLWRHHEDTVDRNSFYNENGIKGTNINSTITVLFNEEPGTVKGFLTVNYEGTKARITENISDAEYYNNEPQDGWFVSSMITNLQETEELEFKGKEEKWFTSVQGVTTELENLDTKEFSVQGIGNALSVETIGIKQPKQQVPAVSGCTDIKASNYNSLATVDDGTCQYAEIVSGCTDDKASNYNSLAVIDDGSCIYPKSISGCIDNTPGSNPDVNGNDVHGNPACWPCDGYEATNYNPAATVSNNSCLYQQEFDVVYPNVILGVNDSGYGTYCGSCSAQVNITNQWDRGANGGVFDPLASHIEYELEYDSITEKVTLPFAGNMMNLTNPHYNPLWIAAIQNLEIQSGTTITGFGQSSFQMGFIYFGEPNYPTVTGGISLNQVGIKNINICDKIKDNHGNTWTVLRVNETIGQVGVQVYTGNSGTGGGSGWSTAKVIVPPYAV